MKTWIVIFTLIVYGGASIAAPVELTKKTPPTKSKSEPHKKQQPGGVIAQNKILTY